MNYNDVMELLRGDSHPFEYRILQNMQVTGYNALDLEKKLLNYRQRRNKSMDKEQSNAEKQLIIDFLYQNGKPALGVEPSALYKIGVYSADDIHFKIIFWKLDV